MQRYIDRSFLGCPIQPDWVREQVRDDRKEAGHGGVGGRALQWEGWGGREQVHGYWGWTQGK